MSGPDEPHVHFLDDRTVASAATRLRSGASSGFTRGSTFRRAARGFASVAFERALTRAAAFPGVGSSGVRAALTRTAAGLRGPAAPGSRTARCGGAARSGTGFRRLSAAPGQGIEIRNAAHEEDRRADGTEDESREDSSGKPKCARRQPRPACVETPRNPTHPADDSEARLSRQ